MTSYRDFTSKDVIFLSSILLMKLALGFYATVFGLGLLDMAQLIGVSQQDISIIIPAKSVGSELGAILVGIYFHYLPFKKIDRVTALALVHFVYAGLCVAIPFSNSVATIGVLAVISGMCEVILDIGYIAIVVDTRDMKNK